MSYVRRDDQHENSRLTQFRERLSGEVGLQTGEEFPIFQDSNDIAWGEQWQQRIDGSLDAVTFLIPVLTPGFFRRPACRDELERFLGREEQLERHDLILPVYYVDCPVLNDEAKRETDPLAKIIAARQRADWREFRFEPFTSPQVGKMIAWMARQIVQSLERGAPANRKDDRVEGAAGRPVARTRRARQPVVAKPAVGARGASATAATTAKGEEVSAPERGPAGKNEPRTRIVDAFHRGDHATLTDALKAVDPGDRILIRPGLYREGVVIDKPVEIIGDGEPGDVVIEANGSDTILFQANIARITNLTLRQTGGGDWYCVDITQGRLDLESCDITSQSNACVAIHEGADPRLRRNRIHEGKNNGVLVYANGLGTLEDNEIFANAEAGVAISEGGNPTLRRNRIHDGKSSGVFVYENGQGILEDNDIFANALAGVTIQEGGNPTLRRNRIHDGKAGGVLVHTNGQGTLEDNDIFANAHCGVTIQEGGNPTLRRNRISGNGFEAIWVHDGGGGVFEDNDLRGNTRGAWDIAKDCATKVTRKGNQE
jgi:F-box protein 11